MKISDVPRSNIFTNTSPRSKDIKERFKKWDYIKLKTFCRTKENFSKMKKEPTIWENIFANDILDKDLNPQKCKELTGLHTRKTKNTIEEWAKDLHRHFSKEDMKRAQRA